MQRSHDERQSDSLGVGRRGQLVFTHRPSRVRYGDGEFAIVPNAMPKEGYTVGGNESGKRRYRHICL